MKTGLDKIVGIRQFTEFTKAGKVQKVYRVTYTTEKTDGEFTLDIPKDEYTAAKALKLAREGAKQIDLAIE